MWLVLCSGADASALWAYQGLRHLGMAPLELVTAESLAGATRWEHRLNAAETHLKITLSNGLVIDGAQVRGVLNRLHSPSELAIQRAVPSDREYAQAELLAFYLSWLNGLPGMVINRPTPIGLCGPWLHPSEWTLRACRAGLRAPVYRQSARDAQNQSGHQPCRTFTSDKPTQTLITLRGEVFGGAVPAGVAQACGKLAAEAGTELLGIDLKLDASGQWSFAGAMPSPDLRPGGMALLRRLAQIMVLGARS